MRKSVKFLYNHKQVCVENIADSSFSKSPLKPMLYMKDVVARLGKSGLIDIISNFKPFRTRDFKNAHTDEYVNDFFTGGPKRESNSIPWSKKLANSVKWTNSSLYNAVEQSYLDPNNLYVSPTSGFHHAGPNGGMGFCTFSGQVIASLKMYRKYGVKGAYLDLDGHYGNSIGDSREFVQNKYGWNLDDIIQMNINPRGTGSQYIDDFVMSLGTLANKIRQGDVDYIVWCHGADSHKDDDLGSQLTTNEWKSVSSIFYTWLNKLELELGRKIPLTLSLFGGYRRDDYQSVINLHLSDLMIGISVLLGKFMPIDDLEIKDKVRVVDTTIYIDEGDLADMIDITGLSRSVCKSALVNAKGDFEDAFKALDENKVEGKQTKLVLF